MPLDPALLDILACPEDKGPLLYFADEGFLYNPRLHRRYEITDDIPIMLIDEATGVDDAEHRRLLDRAEAGGVRQTFEPQPSAGSSEPGSSEPGSSEPGSSEPGSSEPGSSEPGRGA